MHALQSKFGTIKCREVSTLYRMRADHQEGESAVVLMKLAAVFCISLLRMT